MTPPWHGLGAHQRHLLDLRTIDTLRQASLEIRGLHVIGIAAESRVAPATVHGVGARVPQPAQTGQVRVLNAGSAESRRQQLTAELRIVARSRNRSYIEEASHTVLAEQADELLDRPRGMPDRENATRRQVLGQRAAALDARGSAPTSSTRARST